MRPGLLSFLTLTLATGCASSPPLNYYTLTEAAATAARPAAAANIAPFRLDRVTVPPELDRSQVVRRLDATRLQIMESDRWAAPLEDMIRRVLSADLSQRLSPGAMVGPNEPSVGEKRQSLSVDIQDFYADGGCAVTLQASWVLKRADAQSLRGDEETHLPGAGTCAGSASVPTAMSQALGELSDRIAAAIVKANGS